VAGTFSSALPPPPCCIPRQCLPGFATCQDDIDVPYRATNVTDADLNANVEPKVSPKGSHLAF
jgi:hypothetical protein